MDKISKEELMKKLGLSEEEMEKVVGGYSEDISCEEYCLLMQRRRAQRCDDWADEGAPKELVDECHFNVTRHFLDCPEKCEAGEITP